MRMLYNELGLHYDPMAFAVTAVLIIPVAFVQLIAVHAFYFATAKLFKKDRRTILLTDAKEIILVVVSAEILFAIFMLCFYALLIVASMCTFIELIPDFMLIILSVFVYPFGIDFGTGVFLGTFFMAILYFVKSRPLQ